MFRLIRMCVPFCATYAAERVERLESCCCMLKFHSFADGFGYSRWNTLKAVPVAGNMEGRFAGNPAEIGAAAAVLTGIFGDNSLVIDRSQERLGFAPRVYPSFDAVAEEAAMSRLYGGIHFRSANEAGLAQGRCIGSKVMALQMGH